MKIAVIAHAHFAIKQPYAGGLEAHTDVLVRELLAKGHEVTLFAKAGSKAGCRLVPIFFGDAKGGDNPLLDWGYRLACNYIQYGNYDLVFNNSLSYIPLEWHNESQVPMITVFHTPPLPKMVRALKSQPDANNRTFIAVSALTAEQWQPHCQDVVNVVSNGISEEEWPAHTTKPTNPRAIWSGRITPEKGTHIAIQAAIKAGLPITICGSVYDRNYYRKIIKPLLDNPLVDYVGHLRQTDINREYKRASVALVTPLWDEPFGYVAVEALASGVPVAALPNGALPTILTYQTGALAKNDSVDSLVSAIDKAITKDRATCAQYVRDNFTNYAMINEYLRLAPAASESSEQLRWQPNA